ncbi:MAG: arginine--tRNA ligase, partial [bacterium]
PADRVPLKPIPFSGSWGLASPIGFVIAKEKAAQHTGEIQKLLTERLRGQPYFDRAEAVNGYLNIYFQSSEVARRTIAAILSNPDYGRAAAVAERVMIEYSQPNTHKAFHIGHLRNTCLGLSLAYVLKCAGYPVVTANYYGDIGAHVFKFLWGYSKFHSGESPPSNDRAKWMNAIYTEAHRALESAEQAAQRVMAAMMRRGAQAFSRDLVFDGIAASVALTEEQLKELANLMDAAIKGDDEFLGVVEHHQFVIGLLMADLEKATTQRPDDLLNLGVLTASDMAILKTHFGNQAELKALFQQWEVRDPALIAHWKQTREWSLEDFRRIYAELGASFDVEFFESEVQEPGKAIAKELLDKGVAELSGGAIIVDIDKKLGLNKKKFGALIVLRSDGTSLYATKDLALAKTKFENYQIDRSVYVVATPQSFYFQQLFKVLDLWGFPQAKRCHHLPYEIVTLPEGTMSSRSGRVVLYSELAAMMREKAKKTVDEKAAWLPNSERQVIAEAVADGAMKFTMLSRDNNKVLVFDPEEALDFEGRSAPYIQYAYARATRILEKSEMDVTKVDLDALPFADLSSHEKMVLQGLQEFPEIVQRAAKEYRPNLIATYCYDLAHTFSDFYHQCDVIHSEAPVKAGRLALVAATRQVLKAALGLIGISPLERM